MLTAKLDEIGRPAWILLTIVLFWMAWPLGLAMLAYLAGSGRLRGMRAEAPGTWFNLRGGESQRWRWPGAAPLGSGNQAFDDYRTETLRRLEEEQREFQEYLERLRRARDKAEFDQFMAERRRHRNGGGGADTAVDLPETAA